MQRQPVGNETQGAALHPWAGPGQDGHTLHSPLWISHQDKGQGLRTKRCRTTDKLAKAKALLTKVTSETDRRAGKPSTPKFSRGTTDQDKCTCNNYQQETKQEHTVECKPPDLAVTWPPLENCTGAWRTQQGTNMKRDQAPQGSHPLQTLV